MSRSRSSSEELCEVEDDGIRNILRRNPIRAEEVEKTRKGKIEKVQRIIEKQNEYLAEHKRAQVLVAKRKVGEYSYQQIPEPPDLGKNLLRLANVTLPETITCKDINVTTRKKLPERRKKPKNQVVRA